MSRPQPYGYPVPVQPQVLVRPYRSSTAHVAIAWMGTLLTGFSLLPWEPGHQR